MLTRRDVARGSVSELDMFAHLYHQTVYEDLAYSRPAMQTLRRRLLKKAKRRFGLGDELLVEPPNLVRVDAPGRLPGFAALPHPLTQHEVIAHVGDAYKYSHRFDAEHTIHGDSPSS